LGGNDLIPLKHDIHCIDLVLLDPPDGADTA
jgi:hypothetical protein